MFWKKSRKENEISAIEEGARDVKLECGEKTVFKILSISSHGLIAVASNDKKVRVYSQATAGECIHVFDKHMAHIYGLEHLFDDVLASVDFNGTVFTWKAGSKILMDKFEVRGACVTSMKKLSDTLLGIGTSHGEVKVLYHDRGIGLKEVNRLNIGDSSLILDLAVYGEQLITVTISGVAMVLNYTTREHLATFQHEADALDVTVSDNYIATSCRDGKIHVRKRDGYSVVSRLDLNTLLQSEDDTENTIRINIRAATWISSDLIMVITEMTGIFFISLEKNECVAHFLTIHPSKTGLSTSIRTATVLEDGRVCIGGSEGHCVITHPPPAVKNLIKEFSFSIHTIDMSDFL